MLPIRMFIPYREHNIYKETILDASALRQGSCSLTRDLLFLYHSFDSGIFPRLNSMSLERSIAFIIPSRFRSAFTQHCTFTKLNDEGLSSYFASPVTSASSTVPLISMSPYLVAVVGTGSVSVGFVVG